MPQEEIERLALKIDPDLDVVCNALATIEDDDSKEPIARCFCLISAADGQVTPSEEQMLQRLLQSLGQEALIQELPALGKQFRREDATFDQALFALGDAATAAGSALTDAASTAGTKVGQALSWAG